MIFGIKTGNPPDTKNFRLEFFWGVLNRARIAVMSKIIAGVFLVLPFMLLFLDEEKTSATEKVVFFLIGLMQIPIIYFCEKPEFMAATYNRDDGLQFGLNFFGFHLPLKTYPPENIADIGVKCDFAVSREHATTRKLMILFKDRSTFSICLGYSLMQEPSSEDLRLARITGEIMQIYQQPCILGSGKPEMEINPQTGLINFKGIRFCPKNTVL